jgi:DNA-binding NarL/FixJ family response regulator
LASARHKKFTACADPLAHPAVILFTSPYKVPKAMPQEASRTLRVLIVSDVRVVQEGLHSVLARLEQVEVVSTVDTLHARYQSEQLHPDVVLFDAARHDSVEFLKDLVASVPQSKVVAFGVKETDEEILALAAAGTAGYVCNSAESSDVVRVLEQVMCDELPCSPRAAASLYRRVATLSRSGTEAGGTGNGSGNGNCDGSGRGSGRGNGNSSGDGTGSRQGDVAMGDGNASRNGGGNGSLAMSDGRGDGRGHAHGVPLSRRELQIAQLVDCGLTNKQIGRKLGIEAATVKNHVHNLCEKLKVHRRGEAAARIRAIAQARVPLSASAPDRDPALEAMRVSEPSG